MLTQKLFSILGDVFKELNQPRDESEWSRARDCSWCTVARWRW